MAVAIGLGAWELGTLAVAGITALYLASPAGQRATQAAANKLAHALDKPDENTAAPPQTVTDCPDKAKERTKCPPCPPPPPPRIDRVPPSRPHAPCLGDHVHLFVMNQNPVTCQCFPGKDQVVCISQGAPWPSTPLS